LPVRSADGILHGDNDARASLPLTGVTTAKLIKGSKLVVYEGAHASGVLCNRASNLHRGVMREAAGGLAQ
jgi:hypothetical protein